MDTAILEELGLSKGEITVYLTLLKLGTTKVGSIIEKSNMASSAVHNSLNSLLEKGLISFIKKGKIKHYQSSPPEYIGKLTKQKLEKFNELLPELKKTENLSKDKQEAEVFEGVKGVTSMLNLLIEDAKKGDKHYFFSANAVGKNKEIQDFFERYDFDRKEKGLLVKGLVLKELRPYFEKRKMLNVKYPNIPIPTDMNLCNNKISIITWEDKPVGFLIRSKEVYEKYLEYFEKIWKIS